MENKKTESDFFYSFDRNYSAKIHFKKPDKYREIENLSKIENNIISSGSNLSYSPLSFGEGSLSVILRKFNRIIKLKTIIAYILIPMTNRCLYIIFIFI